MNYQNLDIQFFRSANNIYVCHVQSSVSGEAQAEFENPFSELELENFVLKIGRTRSGTRRLNSPEMRAAQLFGSRLFNGVFQGPVHEIITSSINQTNQSKKMGLRIRLRLGNVPELANYPWEFLYHPTLKRFIAHSTRTPIIRYADLPHPVQPLKIDLPLRLLVIAYNPPEYPSLNIAQEKLKMKTALNDLVRKGLISIEWLDEASLASLQKFLRQKSVHILHFIGHGGWDDRNQDGFLIMDDAKGGSRWVYAGHLATILHDHADLRMVFLNTCEGGRVSTTDAFAGVAGTLVQQGIPAVVSMQFEITDKAAVLLSQLFYESLADEYPAEAALAEARKALFASGNDVEWGTPVLYLRSTDGKIFDISNSSPKVSIQDSSELHLGNIRTSTPLPPKKSIASILPIGSLKPIEFDWVRIPSGEFVMGSNPDVDKEAKPDEQPQHSVNLPEYQISRVPVTIEQFAQFILETEYKTTAEIIGTSFGWTGTGWKELPGVFWFQPRGPGSSINTKLQHPVTCVSWFDAIEFCKWANVRLPSEAEWEKAARGNNGQLYPWGNETPEPTRGNFSWQNREPVQVGQYPNGASPYGILDMAGNIWQWTSTLWGVGSSLQFPYPYKPEDGRESLEADINMSRVLRGSAYDDGLQNVRCATRQHLQQLGRDYAFGFRVALDAK